MKFEKVTLTQYAKAFNSDIDLTQEYNDIKLPCRGTKYSAGYDFFSPFAFDLEPNETIIIPTGVRWVCNENEMNRVLQIFPRSGLGFKYQLCLANTVGIIDSDFAHSDNGGHIMVKLVNRGDKTIHIEKGKGFVQGIITEFLTVEDEKEITEQRNGGFGSTDKK